MLIDPDVHPMSGIDCLQEAIETVPIPSAPPRLSRDGAAVGLAFLDIALRQNHVRRLTERLTLVEHRTARCATEVDISLGLLDPEQREAALLYQQIRSRSIIAGHEPLGPHDSAAPHGALKDVMWVPISLARRSYAPVDVVNGEGVKLPRLTQYETSRLLASAMYRLFRLILASHPDVTDPTDKSLHDFLFYSDKARWLVQAALVTLLTERSKPAVISKRGKRTEGTVSGFDAECRKAAWNIFIRYRSTLHEYMSLLDLAVNDYLLVVALDPSQDEHLLAFDSPLHVEVGRRRSLFRQFRPTSGAYWVEYRTRLPANLRAYHLVAQTEETLEIDTMCLTSNADESIVSSLSADLRTVSSELQSERQRPTGRRGERIVELELQSCLRRLSELLRRRRWEASKANIELSEDALQAAKSLEHAAIAGEAVENVDREPYSSLFRHRLVTPERLSQAAAEIAQQQLHLDLSVENDPASPRAHVYWRRDPSRVDRRNSIQIFAEMFIRDNSGARPASVILYVAGVVGISYLLGALLFESYWPFGAGVRLHQPVSSDAIIAVLLLVPGFFYTRLNLPVPQTIAGQLQKVPRMVARVTIGAAAVMAATFAASDDTDMVRYVLAAGIVASLLSVLAMLLLSRPMVRDKLPVTSKLPIWVQAGAGATTPNQARGRVHSWWLRRNKTRPDAVFSTTNVQSVRAEEAGHDIRQPRHA